MSYIIIIGIYSILLMLFFAYLHRHLIHKSVIYSPALIKLMKTFDWLLTNSYSSVKNWYLTADHVKHHMTPDSNDDPHSPVYMTTAEFKSITKEEAEKVMKNHNYPSATALDNFYKKYPYGLYITMTAFTMLIGWVGVPLTLLLAWIPDNARKLHAYGCHMWPGYVNYKLAEPDKARNVPYFFFFGEELHGNHHKWQSRANFAVRWYELDITYHFLRLLEQFKLVTIIGDTGPVAEDLKFEYIRAGSKIIDK